MKKIFLLIIFSFALLCCQSNHLSAQTFSYSLTGNPVIITDWTMSTISNVIGDEVQLTQPTGNQAGYIYVTQPTTLSNCAQFTATFEFSITESSFPTADGIAFWFITNPPTGFVSGSALGLPTNPNGLVLAFDTYDNNSTPDNPLVSLRRYDGSTFQYDEGSATGLLCPDLHNQSFITDGSWHTCTLNYANGNITVSFDGNPPVMSGTTDLSGLVGYFGFTASTGASYANQSIRNVSIVGDPLPPAPEVNDVTYCLNAPADPLTASGDVLHWYTTPTGGVELPAAPTPSTATPGVYTWYVSQTLSGCDAESERSAITVTVSTPPPAPTVTYDSNYCLNDPFTSFVVNGQNPLWYDAPTGGTGTATTPVVNTATPGTYTWYVSQTIDGCEGLDRTKVTVVVHESPIVDFHFTLHYGCSSDTVVFQNLSTYATNYIWDFDDNGITDTNANPTHVYYNQGIHQVKLISSAGECVDSMVKQVDLQHPLNASFYIDDDTVCAGTAIGFSNFSTDSVVNGFTPTFHWDLGDGNVQDGSATFYHAYENAGTYTAVLTVTDGVPCTDTAMKIITVDPSPEVTISKTDSLICTGDNITFTANLTQQGLQTITWNFDDSGDSVIDVNPVAHSYDEPGNFTVTVTGKYRACPNGIATALVAVNPIPVINLGNDDSLCFHGAPIILTDSANLLNPNAHWHWDSGDTTPYFVVRHHGVYKATVTVGGCSNSDEVKIYKDCYIDVPNSFTPNDDGVNDYFFPRQYLSEGVVSFKMTVFNRWGEQIFETTNTQGRGWDGRFNGNVQPAGVYVYIIDLMYKNKSVDHYSGNVTLLR